MNKGLVGIFVCLMFLFIPVSSAIVIDIDSLEKPDPKRGWAFLSGLIFKPEINDGVVDCIAIRLRYSYGNLFSGGYAGVCTLKRVTFEEGPVMGKIGLVRFVFRAYFGNFTIYLDDIPD